MRVFRLGSGARIQQKERAASRVSTLIALLGVPSDVANCQSVGVAPIPRTTRFVHQSAQIILNIKVHKLTQVCESDVGGDDSCGGGEIRGMRDATSAERYGVEI